MEEDTTDLFTVGKEVEDKAEEVYDIHGQWRLLYRRDGHDDGVYNNKNKVKAILPKLYM